MNLPRPLIPLVTRVAYWDRRISTWRERARLLLLQRELGDRLAMGPGSRVEPGVIWRMGDAGRVTVGPDGVVRTGAELKVDGRLAIGARALIGAWCTLSVLDELVIGDDCLLAERVSIRDHDHRFGDPDRPVAEQGYEVAPVRLGRNVWIGAGVTVLRGVTLGESCVVGANAVVTRSFPAGSVIAGVPARLIAERSPEREEGYACPD
jgi:acetyltransferase-like isoleucine patch superfamily enzyme